MTPLAIILALLAQSGTEDKSPPPPFKVVITAKTNTAADVEMRTFEEGLKELKKYATLVSKSPVTVDRDLYDAWTFEVAGDKKFDPTPFWHTFINIKCKSYKLTLTGTLSQEATTKKLFITAALDKAKVKLMNRPKGSFDKESEVEDTVGKLTERFEEGWLKWKVEGEIFSHGGALAILLETYTPVGAPPPGAKGTPPPKVEAKKTPPPPFLVVVTAKTKFARGKRTYQEFLQRIEKVKPYCRLVSQSPMPDDNAGWEFWTFEISGDRNLDLGMFPSLFGDMKCSKYELELTGTVTQDPQTKAVFVTSYSGKVKVKVLNRPKQVGGEAEDKVAKFAEAVDKAADKPYFWVEGEAFNQGGQLSILLQEFRKASPPPEAK